MFQIDVRFRERGNLVRPWSLIEHQAPEIMQVSMLPSADEILSFLERRQNVDPNRIFVGRNFYVSNRVLPSPVLLDGMAKEFRQRVQIVTQCDVANLMLFHTPGHVRLNACFVDETYCLASEEFPDTREARSNPPVAVRMCSILRFGPTKERFRRVRELASQYAAWTSTLSQRLTMFRLFVARRRLVSFCGVPGGGFSVPLAVELEVVVPLPAPDSQCHASFPRPAFVTRATRRPDPSDTISFPRLEIGGARPGKEARLDAQQRQRIVALVCSPPPEGRARWTVRLLAEEAVKRKLVPGVGRETVRILLESHDLKPWREKNVVRGRTR